MTTTQSPPVANETPVTTSPSKKATARTRISGAWVAVIAAAFVLTLLLVFLLQNTRSVKITYFTVHGSMPLGIALLLGVIGGVLLAGVFAALRIVQLRRRLSKPRGLHRSAAAGHAADDPTSVGAR